MKTVFVSTTLMASVLAGFGNEFAMGGNQMINEEGKGWIE